MAGEEHAAPAEPRQRWSWVPEEGWARTLLEVLIIIPAYVLYELVRGTVNDRTSEAFGRASQLVHIEQAMGIFWERELQSLALTWDIVGRAANTMYVWGHLPVLIGVAIWLFVFHRHRYSLYRNAFLISGAIGLAVYWLLPTAPPRFLQYWGFVDTAVENGSYYIFQPPAFVNQYAAMPSLHFGWSLLAAVAIFGNLETRFRYVAFVLPLLMLGGIVFTANHFFLDAAAGAVVALLGLSIAVGLRVFLPRRSPFTILA